MTDEPRLDLRSLSADRDPNRVERSAAAIAARVAPSLARRRARPQLLWSELAAWRVPVFAAGTALAALSLFVLLRVGVTPPVEPSAADHVITIAEAAGVPAVFAQRLEPAAARYGATTTTGGAHE